MTDLAVIENSLPDIAKRERISVQTAIQLWLAKYPSRHTRDAYAYELAQFAGTMFPCMDGHTAMRLFLSYDDEQAHSMVDGYRARLVQEPKANGEQRSPASINRSMAALNSFTASARRHGLTKIRLEAETVKSRKLRDTRGPGLSGIRKLITAAKAERPKLKAIRDEAIVRVMFSMGLRRAEVTECDLKHYSGETLSIMGKGEAERRTVTVPPTAKAALDAWIKARGDHPGPLFVGMNDKERRTRLTGAGLHALISALGERAGIRARPHGIRHAAVTAVLDSSNGDLRRAQAFARHSRPATTVLYDDNRQDLGGAASRTIDALIE